MALPPSTSASSSPTSRTERRAHGEVRPVAMAPDRVVAGGVLVRIRHGQPRFFALRYRRTDSGAKMAMITTTQISV